MAAEFGLAGLEHLDPRVLAAGQKQRLALAVAIRFRLSRERRFEVTPLDLLVIFVALTLPNLPGLSGAPSNLGLSVAKLVVLFYALEMLSNHSDRTRAWLWRGALVFLAVLAVRGTRLAMLGTP